MELIRPANNSGKFYPSSHLEILAMITQWNKLTDPKIQEQKLNNIHPKAIVSPHAGYIYSGYTANFAYRLLANRKPKRIIVIGPSHYQYFLGISAGYFDAYQTPFGQLRSDSDYLKELSQYFVFTFEKNVHTREHSTETQFPFIKHYFPDVPVIELVYSSVDYFDLSNLFEHILRDKQNALVISTDLSHFYPLSQARLLDSNCLTGFEYQNIELILNKCEACGKPGLTAITNTASRLYLKTKVLDYRTSADQSSDTRSVVGYMSGIVY